MEPEDLYGLPLERFTDERNALAKERRNDGRRDEAEEVSKLRKPSIAAWAVNQLVRTQRRDIAALCDAGDALREAQEKLLSGGGDADALRDAVEAVRVAVEQLTDRARGLLSSEGNELSPATLARVSETLNAAALDQDARAKVQGGCLVRELHHVGLGALEAGPTSGPAASRSRRSSSKRAAGGQASRGEKPQAVRVAAARRAEADARHRAERTARDLATAQERRDRAAGELRGAEEALRDAEERLATAEEAAADALRELEALQRKGRHT